jgi:dihydrofolate reductase
MQLSIIVAMDNNALIGNNNALPWHLPADLIYFKKQTLNKTVLMGRKTYESIGKPLPNRRNIIISRNKNFNAQGCEVVHTIKEALEITKNEATFLIGGANLYTQMLPLVNKLYITYVEGDFKGDAYFPDFKQSDFIKTSKKSYLPDEKNPHSYHFIILEKK